MLTKNSTVVYQKTLKTLQRFPLPTFCCLLVCCFFLCMIHIENHKDFLSQRVSLAVFKNFNIILFGFLFFIVFKLLIENRKGSLNSYYFFGMTLFSSVAWYLYTLPMSTELVLTSALIVIGLFLILLAAPCFYKTRFSLQSWAFTYQICLHLCFLVLSSIFLFISLLFIQNVIEYLFDVSFGYKWYIDISCITFTAIFPILFMSGIPKKIDNLEIGELKYINTVLNYLIAPLLFIYTIIIWAYLLKILITWELPKDRIVCLTSIFSWLGMITYLSSYPLHHNQSIIGAFGKHFFKLLPVPLLGFSVGIGVRVYHYGITEYRYFCLLFLIWLMLSTGFAFFKKAEEVPKFVLSSLPILLLIASLGPCSAVNISTYSQRHRLAVLLEKNRILIAGKIQKSKQQLTPTDCQEISSIITYLVNREKIDCLRSWLTPDQIAQINSEARSSRKKMMMQAMGVEG